MRIVLVGAGRVATHLGPAFAGAGHQVVQVYSRTMASAKALADGLKAVPVTSIAQVSAEADVYILSVKDSVLPTLIAQLCPGKAEKLFLHTAGSIPMDVFRGHAEHFGVLYPMQTFSKERAVSLCDTHCFCEANSAQDAEKVMHLARSISNHVHQLSSSDRRYLHLSAVFACNFANHCFALGGELIGKCGLPFDVLMPLIEETVDKLHTLPPLKAQTGPAVRYDENVIESQMRLLEDDPLTRQIYADMSQSIHKRAEND